MQVSAQREKESWQRSRQRRVFPGHERLAAPNWDYPPPLGRASDEPRRQGGERCAEKLKETATEETEDGVEIKCERKKRKEPRER